MTETIRRGGSKPLDRQRIIALMRQGYTVQRIQKLTGWSYSSIKTHVIMHQIEEGEDFGVESRDGLTKAQVLKLRREIKELMDFNRENPPTMCYIMEKLGTNRQFTSVTLKAWRAGELNDDGTLARPASFYRRGQTKG